MDRLLDRFDAQISGATLKPSSGGRFEVSVDGNVVFSKLKMDRFPEEDELEQLVTSKIGTES